MAAKYGVAGYQPEAAKQHFFANYLASIAGPDVQIVYPGALGWWVSGWVDRQKVLLV